MCNEELNLVKLLGDCPKGTKLYSPIAGEVVLREINKNNNYPILCDFAVDEVITFTSEGHYYSKEEIGADGECMLFPSKDNRDWSTFCPYKDGDFLADDKDGRAFIFRGKSKNGNPMAYGGVDTCDTFISSENNRTWSSNPYRKATKEEINYMMIKMTEAGYIWDADKKQLKKDLPIDTLVAVCDSFSEKVYFHSMIIRRYAGKHRCFNNNGGSNFYSDTTSWRHIIPLNELTVDKEGIVELCKVKDYGTHNYHA